MRRQARRTPAADALKSVIGGGMAGVRSSRVLGLGRPGGSGLAPRKDAEGRSHRPSRIASSPLAGRILRRSAQRLADHPPHPTRPKAARCGIDHPTVSRRGARSASSTSETDVPPSRSRARIASAAGPAESGVAAAALGSPSRAGAIAGSVRSPSAIASSPAATRRATDSASTTAAGAWPWSAPRRPTSPLATIDTSQVSLYLARTGQCRALGLASVQPEPKAIRGIQTPRTARRGWGKTRLGPSSTACSAWLAGADDPNGR